VISRLTDAEFVNPDRLISTRLGRHPETLDEARLGQALADGRREALLAEGRSLVAESTFSHASKLDLVRRAKGLGFRVLLFHLGLDSGDLAVARVAFRAARGGHPVPRTRFVDATCGTAPSYGRRP
jgi:predicted ABC-type ATPase